MSRWEEFRARFRRPAQPVGEAAVVIDGEEPPVQSVVELLGAGFLSVCKLLLVIVIFTCLFWFDRIFIFIDSGQAGVRWGRFTGTEMRTYDEGLHIIWPWDRMYLYVSRLQSLSDTSTIYSQDGLEIRVRANVRFHPTYDTLSRLHKDVGPDYVETLVKPEIQSTLRKVLGNFTPRDIYAKDEEGLIKELQETMARDFNSQYVVLDKFLIEELKLPDDIQRAIQDKLTEEQRVQAYLFILDKEEAERKRRIIEATGIRDFEEISGLPILRWRGLDVTEKLATSDNAKVVIIGTGSDQLPLILNTDSGPSTLPKRPEPTPSPDPIPPDREPATPPLLPDGVEGVP